MINLFLHRLYFKEEYTVGKLYIGEQFWCDTIEDRNRDENHDGDLDDPGEEKVWERTAIPFGRYRVILLKSPHFGRELPRILNVNNFTDILIHAGNSAKDSSGCILVGENKIKGCLCRSRYWEAKLVEALKTYTIYGHEIFINII